MTKQSWRNLPAPQLKQPRHYRFAAEETIANLLRIPPIGEYVPEFETKRDEEGAILNADVRQRIQAFTATLTAPPYRGREWARREAKESLGYDKTNQSGQKAAVQPEDTGDGATNL